MTHYRVALAMIGVSIFVVCGQWSGRAAAEVNVDVGPVHVHTGGQPEPPPEIEILTRGPIHEAFAQPVILDEGAEFVIDRRPPPPIDEIIPDEKPEGNHIVWIPGYWSWDSDRNGFIWVSGCWRAVPPNNSWVPGYWAQTSRGYRWIAGFWTAADTEEIEYLPAPPATLEEGPQGAGSADNIWIPGCWVRHEGRYAWRRGFWEPARPNWVWEPAHYVSTPRGYVYVDGYWDYPLHGRGVAFLPVYCPPSLYGRADFRYSPDIVLDVDGLTLNLFISPERHHYYFGDYYGAEYSREGFHPWYEAHDHHDWYDPIFVHQQWRHRDDHDWVQHEREGYDHRRDDKDLRPARNYEAMRAQVARLPEKDRRGVQLARPMKEVVSDKATPYKFDKVDAKTREASANRAKDVHAYQDQRAQWESPAAGPKKGVEPKEGTAPREGVAPKEGRAPANESPSVAPKMGAEPREGVAPREGVTPKEANAPPKELPKPPAKEVMPPEKVQTPEHGAVGKDQPAGAAAQPEKVKIPKPPVSVREPVSNKELTPPPRPEHPQPDLKAQPKPSKPDAPDRSKDRDSSDKDKPEKDKPEKDRAEPARK